MSAVTIDGELVHYEVLGRGRAVILLHGWLGSWRYWIPTMQVLQANYRVYALDLLGFGDSGRNPDKYGVDQQVALLDDFMKQLGLPKAALFGHGLGALVAADFADRYPDKVARLLLVNAPLYNPGELSRRTPTPRAVSGAEAPTRTEEGALAAPIPASGAQAAMRAALVQAARARTITTPTTALPTPTVTAPTAALPAHNPLLPLMTESTPETLLGRCFRRGEVNFEKLSVDVARMDARAPRAAVIDFDSGALLDALRRLPMPTVVIHGAEDPLFPAPDEDVWGYVTHDKEHLLLPIPLPNTRHFPMIEDEHFLRLATDFLEAADISKLEIKERWRRRTR